MAYWTSKLGHKFKKSVIERNEQETKRELDNLRKTEANRRCADCAVDYIVWTFINHGVFLCLRCGSIHRGIGTHISIPKGCTGTYLWGPDEIDRMRSIGNENAKQLYGGDDFCPSQYENESVWRQFIVNKYEHRRYNPETSMKVNPVITIKENSVLISFNNNTVLNACNQDKKKILSANSHIDFFSQFGL